jgi:hypothetical protein
VALSLKGNDMAVSKFILKSEPGQAQEVIKNVEALAKSENVEARAYLIGGDILTLHCPGELAEKFKAVAGIKQVEAPVKIVPMDPKPPTSKR